MISYIIREDYVFILMRTESGDHIKKQTNFIYKYDLHETVLNVNNESMNIKFIGRNDQLLLNLTLTEKIDYFIGTNLLNDLQKWVS